MDFEIDDGGGQGDRDTQRCFAASVVALHARAGDQCPIDAQSQVVPGARTPSGGGGGQAIRDAQTCTAAPPPDAFTDIEIVDPIDDGDGASADVSPRTSVPLADTIIALRELQVRRVFYIKRLNMLNNAVRALVRRALGWRMDLPEAERARINRLAEKVVAAFEQDAVINGTEAIVDGLSQDLATCAAAAQPLLIALRGHRSVTDDGQRVRVDGIEDEMRRLARTLPVWTAWGRDVAGLGEIGLAVLVGEAGDLGNYATPSRLWKRLGLAVIDGERQRKKTDIDAALAHGYNPRRRAEVWSCIGDPLFRAQSARVDKKTGEVMRPAGPYRLVYDDAKAKFIAAGKATRPKHAHAHGTRLMTKRFILDLWKAWRACSAPDA